MTAVFMKKSGVKSKIKYKLYRIYKIKVGFCEA